MICYQHYNMKKLFIQREREMIAPDHQGSCEMLYNIYIVFYYTLKRSNYKKLLKNYYKLMCSVQKE